MNDYDWGINTEYWSNTAYLGTIVYWLNLFAYSALLPFVIRFLTKDKWFFIASFALPLYWSVHLIRTTYLRGWDGSASLQEANAIMITVLASSIIITVLRILRLNKVLRIDEFLDKLFNKTLPSISKMADKADEFLGDPMNDDSEDLKDGAVLGKAQVKVIKKRTEEAQEEAKKL